MAYLDESGDLPFLGIELAERGVEEEYADPCDEDACYTPTRLLSPRGFVDYSRRPETTLLDLLEAHKPPEVEDWDYSETAGWHFHYLEIEIRIKTSHNCPAFLLPVEIINSRFALARTLIDPMRASLRNLAANEGPHLEPFNDLALLTLRLLEGASSFLRVSRDSFTTSGPGAAKQHSAWQPWRPEDVSSWQQVINNPLGLDLSSVRNSSADTLEKTPSDICSLLNEEVRVLHVESIRRGDLTSRFCQYQAALRKRLESRSERELVKCVPYEKFGYKPAKDQMLDYLITPRLTFHGTLRHLVGSIVQHGFVKPGHQIGSSGEAVQTRCGNTYGRGIYTSPNPNFSLSYTGQGFTPTRKNEIPSLKLIVCATLMGRAAAVSRDDNWRLLDEPMPGADSHVANDGYEYIVFNTAQVLPCYVIHFDMGPESARKMFDNIPDQPAAWAQQNQKRIHAKLQPKNDKFPAEVSSRRRRERQPR